MGYVGARDLAEFRDRATFVRISNAGLRESHAHDVNDHPRKPELSGGVRGARRNAFLRRATLDLKKRRRRMICTAGFEVGGDAQGFSKMPALATTPAIAPPSKGATI